MQDKGIHDRVEMERSHRVASLEYALSGYFAFVSIISLFLEIPQLGIFIYPWDYLYNARVLKSKK